MAPSYTQLLKFSQGHEHITNILHTHKLEIMKREPQCSGAKHPPPPPLPHYNNNRESSSSYPPHHFSSAPQYHHSDMPPYHHHHPHHHPSHHPHHHGFERSVAVTPQTSAPGFMSPDGSTTTRNSRGSSSSSRSRNRSQQHFSVPPLPPIGSSQQTPETRSSSRDSNSNTFDQSHVFTAKYQRWSPNEVCLIF